MNLVEFPQKPLHVLTFWTSFSISLNFLDLSSFSFGRLCSILSLWFSTSLSLASAWRHSPWYVWYVFMVVCSSCRTLRIPSCVSYPISRHCHQLSHISRVSQVLLIFTKENYLESLTEEVWI